MARAVASEDEEPGRSVLSCAPSLGLVRDTVFPTPAGSVHSLFFCSGLDCSKSLSWHICFSHCPTIQSIHIAWVMAGVVKAPLPWKRPITGKWNLQSFKPLPKGWGNQVEVGQG